jgi:hypothetical protein
MLSSSHYRDLAAQLAGAEFILRHAADELEHDNGPESRFLRRLAGNVDKARLDLKADMQRAVEREAIFRSQSELIADRQKHLTDELSKQRREAE